MKLCSLAVLVFLAAIPANAENDTTKKDAAQLQGIWEVTAMEGNGNQAPAESFKGMRFLIKGDKLSLSGQAGDLRPFRLDATASPKAIDIFGAPDHEFSKGVYKIKDDTLKLCFSQMTKLPRPKIFDTKGTRHMCFTLKRTGEPGGADQPATAQDTVIEPKDSEAAAEKDLDIFESNLESNPHFLAELLAEERDRVEKLLRAAQKDRPTARPWALDVQMLFAVDVAAGKALQGKKRVAHFKHAFEYLQETHDIAVKTLEESPNETLEAVLPGLRMDLALAALEAGELELAKKHAAETLRNNNDPKGWNYGNIIHKANQILGRCALREGKPADAKMHLLAAGATPGSPQLDSFGPPMQLAGELLEKGGRETVLQYLDLVARFWANPDERTEANSKRIARDHLKQLEAWKKQIRAGTVPTGNRWR